MLYRSNMEGRIKREEGALYLAVWRAYPLESLGVVWQSSIDQLGFLDMWEVCGQTYLPDLIRENPDAGYLVQTRQAHNNWPIDRLVDWYNGIFCLGLVLSLFDRRIPRSFLLYCLLAIVVNAAVCGSLSGVYGRYQRRVQWLGLLPLFLGWLRPQRVPPRK